jgi:hypothetical protein
MLRIHCLQLWYGYSDHAMEEAGEGRWRHSTSSFSYNVKDNKRNGFSSFAQTFLGAEYPHRNGCQPSIQAPKVVYGPPVIQENL